MRSREPSRPTPLQSTAPGQPHPWRYDVGAGRSGVGSHAPSRCWHRVRSGSPVCPMSYRHNYRYLLVAEKMTLRLTSRSSFRSDSGSRRKAHSSTTLIGWERERSIYESVAYTYPPFTDAPFTEVDGTRRSQASSMSLPAYHRLQLRRTYFSKHRYHCATETPGADAPHHDASARIRAVVMMGYYSDRQ